MGRGPDGPVRLCLFVDLKGSVYESLLPLHEEFQLGVVAHVRPHDALSRFRGFPSGAGGFAGVSWLGFSELLDPARTEDTSVQTPVGGAAQVVGRAGGLPGNSRRLRHRRRSGRFRQRDDTAARDVHRDARHPALAERFGQAAVGSWAKVHKTRPRYEGEA
ncbi:MAG: hypothetical protein BJ554DRAFT_7032 [Olpidium bornovanus]|uniref:Uncharacterized protein n=1 Tax=Olpidium bornovanus TaxID=278681 RepID=A0A8H7ZWW4_9FUNG|nr:MAG: hypothetical protein BJ554DRAFT_7032 [Olpidium bornovanus]